MYKTLDDLNRVISLGKPQQVIDLFSLSYRTGIATRPYLDAEEDYARLKDEEDRDNKPAILDEDDQELFPEIDYNQIRDDAIVVLETDFPHLVEPAQTTHKVFTGGEDGMDPDAFILVDDQMPTVEERRPEITPAPADILSTEMREYKKNKRRENVGVSKVTTAAGNEFDADELSQNRMARVLLVAESIGVNEVTWVLAGNTQKDIPIGELTEALGLAMQEQSAIWFIGS